MALNDCPTANYAAFQLALGYCRLRSWAARVQYDAATILHEADQYAAWETQDMVFPDASPIPGLCDIRTALATIPFSNSTFNVHALPELHLLYQELDKICRAMFNALQDEDEDAVKWLTQYFKSQSGQLFALSLKLFQSIPIAMTWLALGVSVGDCEYYLTVSTLPDAEASSDIAANKAWDDLYAFAEKTAAEYPSGALEQAAEVMQNRLQPTTSSASEVSTEDRVGEVQGLSEQLRGLLEEQRRDRHPTYPLVIDHLKREFTFLGTVFEFDDITDYLLRCFLVLASAPGQVFARSDIIDKAELGCELKRLNGYMTEIRALLKPAIEAYTPKNSPDSKLVKDAYIQRKRRKRGAITGSTLDLEGGYKLVLTPDEVRTIN